MRNQIVFALLVSLLIFVSRSSDAGFLDDLLETVEESVGEIEKSLDKDKVGSEPNQEPGSTDVSSPKGAKDIASSNSIINFFCPPPPLEEPKKLPKGMVGLESDFGKSTMDLFDTFKNTNDVQIPFILTLKHYSDAFDGPEIKELFNNFINSRDPHYLALIREVAIKKDHRLTWVNKADALFAYGLVHVYYQNFGGNAEKGYGYITKAANGIHGTKHKQYGASYIEGTRRYNGYGKDINLSAATKYMNKAYEIARNRDDSFAKTVQTEFLRLISEPANPHKNLYADLGRQADSMRQAIMQEFSDSARSANPAILRKSQKLAVKRNDLLIEIGTISGMGKDLEEFKVRAKQLASQADPSNSVVRETIILGDGFTQKIEQRMGSLDKLNENGLMKLEAVHQENENLLYATGGLTAEWFTYMAVNISNGGEIFNFSEIIAVGTSLDGMVNRMCSVREAIIHFGERTDVTINSETELQIPEDI